MLKSLLNKIANAQAPLRPPGAVEESKFADLCIRCRKCEQVCPYGSIKMSKGAWGFKVGTPIIYPREIPCYLCMDCPPECPTGALQPITEKEDVRMGKAVINEDTCLPYVGILCRACYERCPIYREAIILEDELYPKVIEEKCTGCGICENVCPNDPQSIRIVSAQFNSDGDA